MHNEAFMRAVMAERARDRENALFLNALIRDLHDDELRRRSRSFRTIFGIPKRRATGAKDGSGGSGGFDQVAGALGRLDLG
jgi:hypothetical protein